jgi:hypothetical protein
MKELTIIAAVVLACAMPDFTFSGRLTALARGAGTEGSPPSADPPPAPTSAELDQLLAPIALYPDQLLAQVLLCAGDPAGLTALNQFIKSHPTLKGSELQDAVLKDNFEASFVALALFPQTVAMMAGQLDKTAEIGRAFAADKTAVFASIQRLRAQARNVGNLKSTPQQEVETKTTSSGEQVIVIEPANPQVVYVPTYNPQTVYVQSVPTTTTVVVQEQSNDAAIAAGVIGFTAGIAIGAAVNNNYYYGPYGWHGGAYMYNDAWNDYYDHREDAREDWMDHREDMAENRGDRAQNAQEQRSERRENTGEQRTERTQNRQENRPESTGQRAQQPSTQQSASTSSTRSPAGTSYESRGHSQSGSRATTQAQTGTRSDAFSGYSSGSSQRAASSRGQSSRSSSRGSRGGGGGRRR